MRHLLLIILFLNSFAFAQDTIEWLNGTELAREGYYRNYGFTQVPVKIGITRNSNSASQLQYLKLNNPHTNVVVLTNMQGDTLYKTGDFLPYAQRPVYFWDFVLPLPILKSGSDSLILTVDNSGETQVMFLKILNANAFEKIKSGDTFMYGGLLAYAIFFAGMFITLGLLKKNNSNILFGIFVIFSMLWIFNIEGVLYQFLWPNNIFFHFVSRVFFSSLTIGSFILYFILYYTVHIHPIAKKFFYAFVVFFLVRLSVVLLFPQIRLNTGLKYVLLLVGTLVIIIGFILMIVYLILLFRKKELFYHNIGMATGFLFILKESFKLTGIDIFPIHENENYLSIFILVLLLTTISIDNLQTYRRGKKRKTEMEMEETRKKDKEISDRILEAQENERSSIAKNIHDQAGGLLAALKIQLETLSVQGKEIGKDDCEKLIQMVDSCSNELYAIVDDLSAPEFHDQELSFIIQNRISLYEQSTGICFQFEPHTMSVDVSRGLNIYRIVCELITNSIRHASCENVFLEIKNLDDDIHIVYSDDGVGFDTTKVNTRHGLHNIKSRLHFMNGQMNVDSRPGKTIFNIRIPLA